MGQWLRRHDILLAPTGGGMCPEGRLSGLHGPSGLNEGEVDSEGKVLVCVCVCALCVHAYVCACVFGVYVCMRARVWCAMCMCVHVCVPACGHVWH